MKKNLLLRLAPLFVLVSCSDDDTPSNETNVKTLAKTIAYEPLESNYNTKRVAYYNTLGKFTADTLFDSSGNILERTAATYTATTYTLKGYDPDNIEIYTATDTFDTSGRIISRTSVTLFDSSAIQFTYNTNGTITCLDVSGGIQIPLITYTTNSDGLIISSEYGSGDTYYVNFEDSTPSNVVQYINDLGQEQLFTSFNYYDVQKPDNTLLSITERNNRILPQNELNQVAETYSLYIKSYQGIWEFNRTFDADNYITYSKQIPLSNNNSNFTSETFYYYN